MTTKQKNIAVIIGFVVVLMMAYQFAIKNTINTRKELLKLKDTAAAYKDIPNQLSYLKAKESYLDSILAQNKYKITSLENNILQHLNTYADSANIKISSFHKPHKISTDLGISNNYEFTVEGNYNKILGLIYSLEQQTKFGEINHLQIVKRKNLRTGKIFLVARIILNYIS